MNLVFTNFFIGIAFFTVEMNSGLGLNSKRLTNKITPNKQLIDKKVTGNEQLINNCSYIGAATNFPSPNPDIAKPEASPFVILVCRHQLFYWRNISYTSASSNQ